MRPVLIGTMTVFCLFLHPRPYALSDVLISQVTMARMKQLPLDLLRCILEDAARMDKRTALSLILTARWVREWVDPVLYESVSLLRKRTSRLFLRTLLSSSSRVRSFYRTHVKSISLSVAASSSTIDHMATILEICKDITHLTMFFVPNRELMLPAVSNYPSTALEKLVSGLRPSHLSMHFPRTAHVISPDFRLAAFSYVTHLSVMNDWIDWSLWVGFELLASLSHISVDFKAHASPAEIRDPSKLSHAIEHILDHCGNLRLFLLVFLFSPDPLPTRDAIVKCMMHDDRRLVFVRDPEPFRDRHANGEDDLWEMGEEIVTLQGRVGRMRSIAVRKTTEHTLHCHDSSLTLGFPASL